MAEIVAVVVVRAVAIVLAVGLVVFLVITEEVHQRETVMDRDVVHACTRHAAVMIEQIGRTRHAAAELTEQVPLAGPISSQRTAISVVPFRPLRRKRSDLIAAETDIPWFCNELDRCEN